MAILMLSCNETKTTSNTKTYYNGKIISMVGNSPNYLDAVVVDSGKIVFTGALDQANKKYKDSEQIDLKGNTLLPGFVDAHSHFSIAIGLVNQVNLTSPPMGTISSFKDIQEALVTFQKERNIPKGEWVIGWGYDPMQLGEMKDITKVEIDAVLPNHKVMLVHISNHGAVLNSNALEWAEITAETPQPFGGVIARMEGSMEPAGMIFETAYLPVKEKKPTSSEEQMMTAIDQVIAQYAENGYTHAQDGLSFTKEALLLKKAAANGKLKIDVAALMSFSEIDEWMNHPEINIDDTYTKGLKIHGVKLVQDGSPQGKTAYMTKPFITGGPAGETDWYGEPIQPREDFTKLFTKMWEAEIPIFVHVNGDAASDDLISALESVKANASQDRRTVSIHTQFLRKDQIDSFVKLGVSPSFFTNHCFYWGDEHIANQGEERASFISPMKSSMNAGLVVSNHTDFNVTPLDPFFVLWTSITRETRSGVKLDQAESLSAYEALQALTTGAAYQVFEENRKGSIKEGLLADFVVLDKNPLKVDVDEIRNISIIETIKEGKTVFKKE